MSERTAAVLAEVLGWPEGERGDLAAKLLESLDSGADDDAAAAWDEEIRTRLEDVRSGRVTPVPWEEARRQIMEDGDDSG
ncbi:MAG TPA: addiction module protein [Gemmataceae bacterium]|nr:addiction module protein [Gemmataceae bacterium]